MKASIDLIMNCIKCNVFDFEYKESDFADKTDDDWKQAYSLSNRHDLSHIICDFAVKNKLISNTELISKFNRKAFTTFQRITNQDGELERIKNVFETNNIPFIILKGSSVRKLYPYEWMRSSCDIDILIEKDELEKAVSILKEKLNYTVHNSNNHHISLYSPFGIHLELHFCLYGHSQNLNLLLQKAWEYSSPKNKDSAERIFTPEFQIFHNVSHLYTHFIEGGCGIRPFVDIKLLLQKTDYDNDTLMQLLKSAEIDVFFEKVVLLSNIWFGNKEYVNEVRTFEKYVLLGGVYGSLKNRVLSEQVENGKTKSFINRLFIPYEALKFSYPNIKKWQTPFFEFVRWADTVKKGVFKKKMNELKFRISTDDKEIEKIKQMMDYLKI